MSDIAIVNISELVSTTSVDGQMEFAVEIPSLGIKRITKDQVLKLFGSVVNVNSVLGLNPFITFDATDYKIAYLNDGGVNGKVFIRMDRVYFNTTDSASTVYVDVTNDILNLEGVSGGYAIRINLGGQTLTLTLDANFTTGQAAYLGTSLDQQLIYNNSLATASSQLSKSCQRSILKIETAAATNATNDIFFPASPKDGYTFELTIKGTITALTCDAGLNTIEDNPATATDQSFKWCYNLANTTWVSLF